MVSLPFGDAILSKRRKEGIGDWGAVGRVRWCWVSSGRARLGRERGSRDPAKTFTRTGSSRGLAGNRARGNKSTCGESEGEDRFTCDWVGRAKEETNMQDTGRQDGTQEGARQQNLWIRHMFAFAQRKL